MKANRIVMAAMIAVFSAVAFCMPAAAADKKYVFEVPVPEGVSVGSLSKMLTDLSAVLSKKVNKQITVKEMPYKKGADEQVMMKQISDFAAGKADMALVHSPIQYMKLKAKADKVMTPYLALTMNGKRNVNMCVYVRKDAPYKTLADLKGKTWGGTYTAQMRFMLSESGINMPMNKFFGKVQWVDDTNVASVLEVLVNKKIDAYSATSYLYEMAKGANKKYSTELRALDCKEFEGVWFMVYNKKTVSPDLAKQIVTIMENAQKDKDFAQFKFMLAAIKGKFAAYNDSPMKTSGKIANLYVKNGWEKEQAAFIKANSKK